LLPDTPSLAWLVLGRVLTIVGGEAGFILLMIQANLVWGQWTPFAIGVGFVAGFATVVQFMAHLSTWLVDESGPANGLGLFMVVMSFAAVTASTMFVTVVNKTAATRRRSSTSFGALNIAATLNSLAPDVGLRWRHFRDLHLRQVMVCIWIAVAWAVFTTQTPYELYTTFEEADLFPDYDLVFLPGRVLGIAMTVPGTYVVYRFGNAMVWLPVALAVCGVATMLSQADVSHYVVNLRQCIGIPLYPIMFAVTTRGLEKRIIPSVAAPHIVARVVAIVAAYGLSSWAWDAPADYDAPLKVIGIVCLVASATCAAFAVYDARTGGSLNHATSDRAQAIRFGRRLL